MTAQKRIQARVFALKGWTIKKAENGKFFIGHTACFDERQKWGGPYESLQNATMAISRKLAEEFVQREKRWKDAR